MRQFVSKHSVWLMILLSLFVIGAGSNLINNGKLISFLDANNFPLVNVFNQTPKEIWISADRTDGKGNGTQADPLDGHAVGAIDTLRVAGRLPAGSEIHLGPGTFSVAANSQSYGPNILSGWNIYGGGRGVTIIKIRDDFNDFLTNGFVHILGSGNGTTDNVMLHHLTLDCNWGQIANAAPDGGTYRTFTGSTSNGSSTIVVTSGDANDVGERVIGPGVPANSWIGAVTDSTHETLSSSAVANVPVNATGGSGTYTLTEKNCSVGAIFTVGSNVLCDDVEGINGYGSNATSNELFLFMLTTGDNNWIVKCIGRQPWGNYGHPFAILGCTNSGVIEPYGAGRNNGANGGFTSGGVNLANDKNCFVHGGIFADSLVAIYGDTGTIDGLDVQGINTVRCQQGVSLNFADITHAITITIASPGVVTWTSHGLYNGQAIRFTTTGALPTGIVSGTIYYVAAKTTDTFQLTATPNGAAINTSGTQSGTHTGDAILAQNINVRNNFFQLQNRGGIVTGLGGGPLNNAILDSNTITLTGGGKGGGSVYPIFMSGYNSTASNNIIPYGADGWSFTNMKVYRNRHFDGSTDAGIPDN